MPYYFLSIAGTSIAIIGYIPEIYYRITSKQASFENLPIWILWVISTSLNSIYCYLNKEYYVLGNYLINLGMNLTTLLVTFYFYYKSSKKVLPTISNNINNTNNIISINNDLYPV
jgi:uncharacterized protein with PQ loop repeat